MIYEGHSFCAFMFVYSDFRKYSDTVADFFVLFCVNFKMIYEALHPWHLQILTDKEIETCELGSILNMTLQVQGIHHYFIPDAKGYNCPDAKDTA